MKSSGGWEHLPAIPRLIRHKISRCSLTLRLKALVDELELAQLSANNRQELARLRSELAEKESQQLDAYLQALRNQLNSQRQLEAERALESTELLAENSADLPKDIVAQFKINRELSAALNQQAQRMDLVASQQRQAASQTLQVRQALNTLREQSMAGIVQPAR